MTRSVWKGPFVHPSLLKKIDKLNTVSKKYWLEIKYYSQYLIKSYLRRFGGEYGTSFWKDSHFVS